MNRIDNSGTGIAGLGRGEDSMLAHVAPGEMVVPPVISPATQEIIRKEMMAVGLDPNEYTVGQGMSINPITGMAEFGFLKKLAKSVKKVVKKIAPVAAVIPGPWQAPAILYNKGRAVVNIAKGEGGLGDIMTVMAGGSQKVFGKDGALQAVKSGDFLKAGGGFKDAFKAIGKVDGAFKPLQYAQNIGQKYMDDQKKGYFGLFSGGQQPMAETIQEGDTLYGISQKTGIPVDQLVAANPGIDPNALQIGSSINIPSASSGGNFIQRLIGGTPGNQNAFQEFMDDQLGFDPGGGGIYRAFGGQGDGSQSGSLLGNLTGGNVGGINPGIAALAALYGKAVKESYKDREGGMKDVRQSIRPDLMPAPTFTGFDLGIRADQQPVYAATGGLQELRPGFAMGRPVMANELDMRMGGPSIGPGTGTSDDIPAMLSDGEFVMTSAANNGLGGFKITKTETGIELTPNGKPNRQKGAKNMDKLMKTFEQFNKIGMA